NHRIRRARTRIRTRATEERRDFEIGTGTETMSHRNGVTLTEVLVAIFIMGIGLLSLLVLFPLGALNMAQAIKDERVAAAERNAEALAWTDVDGKSTAPKGTPAMTGNPNVVNLYRDPGTGLFPSTGASTICYPVYVDPQGVLLNSRRIGYFPP